MKYKDWLIMRFIYPTLLLLLTVACTFQNQDNAVVTAGRQVDIAWGKTVYQKNCAICHDDGTNGAQIIGDVDGWRSRIAKGIPALVGNAIAGYSGALGYMPPRGGNPSLSHEDVTAATWYIVNSSK